MKKLDELVFLSFAMKVHAVNRYDGAIVWTVTLKQGSGFTSLHLDGDRLIASCHGYTWCLDPLTGAEVWFQPFKGMGVGLPSIASVHGSSGSSAAADAVAAAAAAAAVSTGAAAAATASSRA